jgi:Ni/Fe-hydrogenase 1 B-type cytochrome subunit
MESRCISSPFTEIREDKPMSEMTHKALSGNYRRVYVWEFPVRVFHWINAASIFVLIATGLLIAYPFVLLNRAEASAQYVFGTIRFLHFLTAYVFLINLGMRVYWAFVGNQYARWRNFLPEKKEQLDEIMHVIKVDILQIQAENKIAAGHNALANLIYLFFFIASMVQIATGFALYADGSSAWFPQLFTWITVLMDDQFTVRLWHHIVMWFFILFTMVHIYLTFYHDFVEGRGTVSSMVGGWKFLRNEETRSKDPGDSE